MINEYGSFWWGDENVSKLKRWWLHNIVNTLHTTELYTLTWLVLKKNG